VIEVEAVRRSFAGREVLRGVSFRVARGEIAGFLGPNGAGKTTTLRILTTYLAPDEGTARVADHDVLARPDAVRRAIGYLPERPAVLGDHSVVGSLRFCGTVHGFRGRELARRIDEAVDRCGLGDVRTRRVGNLSRGFHQRVGLAQAILHGPEVLLLDEPTAGLDPAQVVAVRDLIRSLAGTRTVLVSTHVLSEVTAMCMTAIVLHRGRVVAANPVAELGGSAGLETAYLRWTADVEPARTDGAT